ncbi:MAG: DUF192 domain-containing protein [Patescibacteria group bacterium]
MNRTVLSMASIAVLIAGTAIFFGLSGEKRISLSAEQVANNSTTFITVGSDKFVVEIADIPEEQAQGLSDRDYLPTGAGMLFVFGEVRPVTFWMNKMRFPLDMIWISDGKVIGVERHVPTPKSGVNLDDLVRYQSTGSVDQVLEVNAGEADSIKVGDKVTISSVNGI